jgi:tetratricopeptide (TPR) repeat protein
VDEAIECFKKASALDPSFAEAHCNLGLVLVRRGQFEQGVQALRRGHQLGIRRPDWPYRSRLWLREAERWARLDGRLPAVLAGKDKPKNAAERLGFARLCLLHRQRYASAARFYKEAFAEQEGLATALQTGHRYDAACAAALAGCGQGKDAKKLAEKERARLRRLALDWLRDDLAAWTKELAKETPTARAAVRNRMQHWRADADFAGVRGPEALGRLPEGERQPWQKLWADVADTLARAQRKTPPQKKSAAK